MSAAGASAGPLRWRVRSGLFYGGAAALFVLAIAGRTPLPLFLAVPFLLAPISAALLGGGPNKASLSWTTGGTAGRVEVSGRLDWRAGPDRARELDLPWGPPAGMQEVAPPQLRYDDRGLSFELVWETPSPMIARIPPPRAWWVDPVGLVERPIQVDGEGLAIERYPPELSRLGRVRLERTIVLPGETRSRAIGGAGEFFGLRPALRSDPPRRTNWAATVRTGRRWVNEFLLERTGDVLVLVDARPTELGPSTDGRILGVGCAAAFGIAEALLHEKARVGLGIYGEFLTFVRLGAGRAQRLRIRAALLDARVSPIAGPSERCAVSMGRYFPAGVTTIVLSPLVGAESPELITYLRRRGFPSLVLSPSPLTDPAAFGDLEGEDSALALRLARLSRSEQIAAVWRDAPVVDWDDYWSLGGLQRLLGAGLGARRRS